MAIENRDTLKTYFETGDVPTQQQFYNLIESLFSMLDDGIFKYEPMPGTKRFGVGAQQPDAPLGVRGEDSTENFISFQEADPTSALKWLLNGNPDANANKGFNVSQLTPTGFTSRMFIQESSGFVGIGTTLPNEKLHVESSTSAGITGMQILNTATANSQGWKFGHLQDSALPERDGAFSLIEIGPLSQDERMIVRTGGNVGINEEIPDTKLHISRSVADPAAALDLIEGTGIVVIGPITDNVVFDYRGLQARKGTYLPGDVLDITAADLNFQRRGGNIRIHGETLVETEKAIITAEARLGLGTFSPVEKIDIDGAIKIGNAAGTNEGTIRFTGTEFQGRVGGNWLPFTGTGPWLTGTNQTIYYDASTDPRVAIGDTVAAATLTVLDEEALVPSGSIAALVRNNATNSGGGTDDHRIIAQFENSGSWGGNAFSKNVGLYAKTIAGAVEVNRNLAAVLNGNVLIGDLVAGPSDVIGTDGTNVLAIQKGATVPTTYPANTIQMYAANVPAGDLALNILTGTGNHVKLYTETAIPGVNNDPFELDNFNGAIPILDNMRARINALEEKLIALGLVEAPGP